MGSQPLADHVDHAPERPRSPARGTRARCPGCGHNAPSLAGSRSGHLHLCDECGLGFDASVVEAGVEAGSGYDGWIRSAGRHRRLARFRLAWLEPIAPPPARMLEIGCGRGYFVDEARTAGYPVAAVEPAPAAADHAGKLAGITVVCERFERAPIPDRTVDLVCSWRTLEYSSDPSNFLARVHRILAPDGVFAIETLNAQLRGPSTRFASAPERDGQAPRLFYTPVALRTALERAGLEVEVCETVYEDALQAAADRGRDPRSGRRFAPEALTHPIRGELIRAIARRP